MITIKEIFPISFSFLRIVQVCEHSNTSVLLPVNSKISTCPAESYVSPRGLLFHHAINRDHSRDPHLLCHRHWLMALWLTLWWWKCRRPFTPQRSNAYLPGHAKSPQHYMLIIIGSSVSPLPLPSEMQEKLFIHLATSIPWFKVSFLTANKTAANPPQRDDNLMLGAESSPIVSSSPHVHVPIPHVHFVIIPPG